MLRNGRAVASVASLNRIAVLALGSIAFAGAGCHSSSPGAPGGGGAGGNTHGDAGSDVATSGAGGGGGTATDGGTGTGGTGGRSGDAATTGAGGAGTTDAASDVFGAGCNTLATGAAVTVTCAPDGGVAPAPTGGTIVPGTYTLTALTQYGSCAPVSAAQTVVITANTVETVVDSALTGLSRENATYVLSGNDVIETWTCPASVTPTTNTFGFSATTAAGVTTLTLISGDTTAANVGVYTKQ